MSGIQRFYAGEFEQISDDEIGLICGSDGVKRDGNDFSMRGIETANFMKNPVFQCEHVPPPIGAFTRLAIISAREAGLGIPGDALVGVVRLAPSDISDYVAEKRGLIKAGFYTAVSLGIDPLDTEPLDPHRPRGGVRVTRSDLLEISAVATPADPTALIVARSFKARSASTMSMLRSLPRLPESAITRAMSQVGQTREAHRPVMSLSTVERTQLYAAQMRQRTNATWAVGQEREAERREQDSYAARQADLRALSGGSTH